MRNIPKGITSKELEVKFAEYGEVLSCKVSLDEKYKSRGYGFVCFKV